MFVLLYFYHNHRHIILLRGAGKMFKLGENLPLILLFRKNQAARPNSSSMNYQKLRMRAEHPWNHFSQV
jgi:hypothetical protein